MDIFVERDLLPDDEQERKAFLKNYFCEITASVQERADGWSVVLSRPHQPDYYIDPDIMKGLAWWSARYGAVDVSSIPFAIYKKPGLQLSLEDSWTLYDWSRWFKGHHKSIKKQQTVTLLHVDDHDDMMTPRVIVQEGKWLDPITGLAFDLLNPKSVESAINSGAIGIGSFMAPLLHLVPNVHIRHLCSTGYATDRQGPHVIRPIWVADDLLVPGSHRPALEIRPVTRSINANSGADGCPYEVTDNLSHWLKDIPNGPVLIHIDMDYFNNRFNGDSDWLEFGPKYDPSFSEVMLRIDQIFEAVRQAGIAPQIVSFSVALSPGFFPTELWPLAISRIEKYVSKLIDTNYL